MKSNLKIKTPTDMDLFLESINMPKSNRRSVPHAKFYPKLQQSKSNLLTENVLIGGKLAGMLMFGITALVGFAQLMQ